MFVTGAPSFDGDRVTCNSMTSHFNLRGHQIGRSFRRKARIAIVVLACLTSGLGAQTQSLPWSQRAADSVVERWPDGRLAAADATRAQNLDLSILLSGMDTAWYESANGNYYQYIKRAVDHY